MLHPAGLPGCCKRFHSTARTAGTHRHDYASDGSSSLGIAANDRFICRSTCCDDATWPHYVRLG